MAASRERSSKAARTVRPRRAAERERQDLVQQNVPLAIHIAKHQRSDLPLEDRIQEGVAGLLRAAELFDRSKGVPFGAYAAMWIRQAISRAEANQCRQVRLPAAIHARVRRIEKEAEVLARRLGRHADLNELGKAMGLPAKKIGNVLAASRVPVSLSAMVDTPASAHSFLPVSVDQVARGCPEEEVMRAALRASVARSLGTLLPRERYVVGRRFGLFGEEETTYDSIAKELCLSRERVRQIVTHAVDKLRSTPETQDLRVFLR